MNVENPFVGRSNAERYARARPALHNHVVNLMLARQPKVRRAIDLACGTGLSTVPLLGIATHVVGMDRSAEMLALAPRAERISYSGGAAERIPFGSASFDLATISSAIHWFGREALGELHRVLRTDGSLVIYDVWFPAEMVDEPRFAEWMSEVCGPRYPSVPKAHDNLKMLPSIGFRQTWAANLRYEVALTLDSLVEYLMTHSDRIAAIRDGRETEEEQTLFLKDGLRSLFSRQERCAVMFEIWVQSLKREPSGLVR